MLEIFVSVDIEADGKLVGINFMLSFGSVAFHVGKKGYKQLTVFEANLLELPGSVRDKKVMDWWKDYPEAWEKIRDNPQPPDIEMGRYLKWLKALPGKPTLVAYPATHDFSFLHWYLLRFTGEELFGWSGLCSRTYMMCLLKKKSWIGLLKSDLPSRFKSQHPHDHTPLNDSIQQAQEFAAMYHENMLIGKE